LLLRCTQGGDPASSGRREGWNASLIDDAITAVSNFLVADRSDEGPRPGRPTSAGKSERGGDKKIGDVKQVTLKPRKFGYRCASLVMGGIDAIIGQARRTEPPHQLAGNRCDLTRAGSCLGRPLSCSGLLRKLVIGSCSR